jgi:hypothetical protein
MTIRRALTALMLAAAAVSARAETVIVENVTLVDFPDGKAHRTKNASIVVVDGTIVQAGAFDTAAVTDARRIDGGGRIALPGLTDMHVHVWDEAELGAYLAFGVTTVRNMSGMPFLLEMQQRIAAGTLTGPHLFTTGPILNSAGPNAQINHQLVETAAEARAAVKAQAEAGYRRLKVYSNLKEPAYAALLEEAKARGLKITGHTPEGERAAGIPHARPFAIPFARILADGFETIEHTESIVWHGLRDRMDEPAARELAARIAASGVAVTPTLLAHHNLVRVAETRGAFAQRAAARTLNPVTQQTEAEYIALWAKQDPGPNRARDAFYGTMTLLMAEAGVPLVTGSDAGIFTNAPGESLVDELELLVRAGLTPEAALAAATATPAQVLEEQGRLGCLASGCAADIAFYDCDPLERIACTRTPAAVMRGGAWLDRAALDALLDAATRPDIARTLRNLQHGLDAQGSDLDLSAMGQ